MPKKRSHGDGALYYVPSRKLWRGVVDVGFGPDGRRLQKSVSSKSQVEARKKLRALVEEVKTNGAPLDKQTTVEAWAEHWLTTVCRPKLKPNTLAAYESVTRTWILPILGKKKVALLVPSDIRLVTHAITAAGKSSSTGLKAYNILAGMLEAARADKIAPRNVTVDVRAPKPAVSDRGALSPDDVRRILTTAVGDVDGSRWYMAIYGGLRQSERLGALLSSLDLDAGQMTVEWALDEITSEHGCGPQVGGVWPCGKKRGASCPDARLKLSDGMEYKRLAGRLCLIRPKSGKSRMVPLHPVVVAQLRLYLNASKDWPNPHGLIWRNKETGAPLLPKEDEAAWEDLLRRAGVIDENTEKIPTTHWARHTTATMLMELGVDAKIIGEVVGHGSEAVTRRYQHVSTPAAVEAMERLGDHLVIES